MSCIQWPDISFGPVNLWSLAPAWKMTSPVPDAIRNSPSSDFPLALDASVKPGSDVLQRSAPH